MRIRTATLALLAVSTCALAGDPPANGEGHRAERMERLATLLDLDDNQKSQVQTILEEQHSKRQALHAEARASGQRPTREQMRQQHDEMQKETMEKLKSVLTDAQLEKFEALKDERHQRRHGPTEGEQK